MSRWRNRRSGSERARGGREGSSDRLRTRSDWRLPRCPGRGRGVGRTRGRAAVAMAVWSAERSWLRSRADGDPPGEGRAEGNAGQDRPAGCRKGLPGSFIPAGSGPCIANRARPGTCMRWPVPERPCSKECPPRRCPCADCRETSARRRARRRAEVSTRGFGSWWTATPCSWRRRNPCLPRGRLCATNRLIWSGWYEDLPEKIQPAACRCRCRCRCPAWVRWPHRASDRRSMIPAGSGHPDVPAHGPGGHPPGTGPANVMSWAASQERGMQTCAAPRARLLRS